MKAKRKRATKMSPVVERLTLKSFNNKGLIDYSKYKDTLENSISRLRIALGSEMQIEGTKVVKTESSIEGENVNQFIGFVKEGKVAAVLTNDYEHLFTPRKGRLRFNRRYCPGEAEYVLFKVLWDFPEDLIWDYLPTVLIFLDLMGLWQTHFDPEDFGDPWKSNIFCLTTGLKLKSQGYLFSSENGDKPNANFEKFIKPTKRVNKSSHKAEPGVLVYRQILGFITKKQRGKTSPQVTSELNKICKLIKAYLKISMEINGMNQRSEEYRQENILWRNYQDLIRSNLSALIDCYAIRVGGFGVSKIKCENDFSLDYLLIYNLFNTELKPKNGDFPLERFIFEIPRIKRCIYKLLICIEPQEFSAGFDSALMKYTDEKGYKAPSV